MNTTTQTTRYRDTPTGIVATRGKREIHVLATSVTATKQARELLASRSFDALFKAAKRAPRAVGPNIRYIRIATR